MGKRTEMVNGQKVKAQGSKGRKESRAKWPRVKSQKDKKAKG
jgi:hypothetical protein